MATLLDPFPDAELVVLDLLNPRVGGKVTATDVTIEPPLTQVERIGGSDNGVTDRARVKITCYGTTRPLAWRMAREIQQIVQAAGGTKITGPNTLAEYPRGVMIDKTVTSSAPKQVPESGRGSRQVETVFEIHLRRPWW